MSATLPPAAIFTKERRDSLDCRTAERAEALGVILASLRPEKWTALETDLVDLPGPLIDVDDTSRRP